MKKDAPGPFLEPNKLALHRPKHAPHMRILPTYDPYAARPHQMADTVHDRPSLLPVETGQSLASTEHDLDVPVSSQLGEWQTVSGNPVALPIMMEESQTVESAAVSSVEVFVKLCLSYST